MRTAKVFPWVAGAALAGVGLFSQANVDAKSLNVALSALPSPKPSCMNQSAQAVAEGYRLSGGNWIYSCGVEVGAGAGTSTVTNCSSSASGKSVELIGWDLSTNTTEAKTGIVTPWTQGVSVALTCTDGKSATALAYGS